MISSATQHSSIIVAMRDTSAYTQAFDADVDLNEDENIDDMSASAPPRRPPYLAISIATIAIWIALTAVLFYVCVDGVEDKGALYFVCIFVSPVGQISQLIALA